MPRSDALVLNTRARVLGLGALVLGLGACGGGGGDDDDSGLVSWPDDAKTGPEPGDRAPNFRLSDPSGVEHELASMTGSQPLVVNFLATWCANCMEEMGILVAFQQDGGNILGVNLRESAETVQELIDETAAGFPIVLDKTGKVTRAFKVVNLPATAVLAADGRITSVIRGPITAESLREAVASAGTV